MDAAELFDGPRREHERIAVGQAQAAVQVVEDVGQREPRRDLRLERTERPFLSGRRERRLVGTTRAKAEAASRRGFERIGQVQVVRPGLGPILPGRLPWGLSLKA